MSIIQRTAWRAARLPLARYSSTASSSGVPFETDINTEPEPLEHYEYAPPVSRQYRPATGWDDMLMRRNFGEPLPDHDELLSMWGPDIPPPGVTPERALNHFLIAAGVFVGFFFTTKQFLTPEPHFIRRTYPHDGLVTELGGLAENKARTEGKSENSEE